MQNNISDTDMQKTFFELTLKRTFLPFAINSIIMCLLAYMVQSDKTIANLLDNYTPMNVDSSSKFSLVVSLFVLILMFNLALKFMITRFKGVPAMRNACTLFDDLLTYNRFLIAGGLLFTFILMFINIASSMLMTLLLVIVSLIVYVSLLAKVIFCKK